MLQNIEATILFEVKTLRSLLSFAPVVTELEVHESARTGLERPLWCVAMRDKMHQNATDLTISPCSCTRPPWLRLSVTVMPRRALNPVNTRNIDKHETFWFFFQNPFTHLIEKCVCRTRGNLFDCQLSKPISKTVPSKSSKEYKKSMRWPLGIAFWCILRD